jgi:hypothetical protein
MKKQHIWVIKDAQGRPIASIDGILTAYPTREDAKSVAIYYRERYQHKYHPVKYVRAAK